MQDSACPEDSGMRDPDGIVVRNEAGVKEVAGQGRLHQHDGFAAKALSSEEHW